MHLAKARIHHLFGGFLRLQAAWRSIFYRQQWLKRRNAILTIQWFMRGSSERRRYRRTIGAARRIQAFAQTTLARIKWLRLRRGLRTLHSLSRGYVIRMHVMCMITAVRTLQAHARAWARRNREYWAKVKGALLFQAVWRGFKTRLEREDIVDFLALRREERKGERSALVLQAVWKGTLVRRRFAQIKAAAAILQSWSRSSQIRSRFLLVQRSARTIQRMGRGLIARARVRDMLTAKMIADELWRIKTIREREVLHIAKMNRNPHTLRQSGFKEGFTSGSIAKRNRGRMQYRFAVLDIDTMVDDSEVYPHGLAPVLYDLMKTLAPNNRRLTQVAVGANHTIALDSSGEVYTFGFGDRGQLGNAQFRNKLRPVKLPPDAFHAAVAVESKQGGRNGSGRAIFNYSTGSPYSGTVRGAISKRVFIRQIAAGEDHTVALTEGGVVFTWGDNSRGQLGHGRGTVRNGTRMAGIREDCPQPRIVSSLVRRKVAEIAAGSHHTMALVVAGSLYTWGSGEQLGLGVYMGDGDKQEPQPVKSFQKFRLRHIGAGVDWSLALTHSGDVYTWGANRNGQLGLNDSKHRLVPSVLTSLRTSGAKHGRIVDVACGGHHAVAVSATGRVYAWGRNNHGQLGLGDRDDRSTPEFVVKLRKHRVMQVAAGWRHSLALTEENQLFAWGMFGAVKHEYPRSRHDPDADNTQFESHLPLSVPFNHVTSSTNQHTMTTMEFPALRGISGISAVSSRSISLTTIQWEQKPGPAHALVQPLLHHSLAVQTREADNLLIDHKEHEPGYASNLSKLQAKRSEALSREKRKRRLSAGARSIIDREAKARSSGLSSADGADLIALTEQEMMMSIPVTPIRTRDGLRRKEAEMEARLRSESGSTFTGDPFAVHPVELQGMSQQQLRELVQILQKSSGSPEKARSGKLSPTSGGSVVSFSRTGQKHGLRMNAGASPVVQHERQRIRAERTLMEKQHRFKHRDYPENECVFGGLWFVLSFSCCCQECFVFFFWPSFFFSFNIYRCTLCLHATDKCHTATLFPIFNPTSFLTYFSSTTDTPRCKKRNAGHGTVIMAAGWNRPRKNASSWE